MAMLGGSVTVASDGTASGSGLALAMYNAEVATLTSDANWASYALAQQVYAKRAIAARWNACGPALVSYIQTNAVAHVSTQQLGRIPASLTQGTPIDAPSSPVDVPIQ